MSRNVKKFFTCSHIFHGDVAIMVKLNRDELKTVNPTSVLIIIWITKMSLITTSEFFNLEYIGIAFYPKDVIIPFLKVLTPSILLINWALLSFLIF